MDGPLIKLDNLSIGHNGQAVLSGISLTIDRGNFTAILGTNGSGKTTLLKTIIGLIPPIAGRIELAGAPLTFGYVPQAVQFDPIYLLTGFEVALMGVYGRVRPGRFVPSVERAFVRECISATGAGEIAHKQFAELSGGQKQRVLIARALATRPDALVLDEPTAGVDREGAHAVMEFISKIRAERKITVLLVTHDFWVARRHAKQVIWLQDRRILCGTSEELLSRETIADIFEMGID